MSNETHNWSRIEQVAAVIFVSLIAIGCWVVLRPFITAILWAAILCYATWPLYSRLKSLCGNRTALAATIMAGMITIVVVVPFAIVGYSFADEVYQLAQRINSYRNDGIPPPPEWLKSIPFLGQSIEASWSDLYANTDKVAVLIRQWLNRATPMFLDWSVSIGRGIVHLGLSMLIAFFFYKDGPVVVQQVSDGVHHMVGDYGQKIITTVGITVKSVVYGLLGTALAQGIMAGIGFNIAGVPGAFLWALLTFFLGLVPFGPPMVWIPATAWLFIQGQPGWGVFMALWGLIGISGIDNILRPILISQGGTCLPFALTLLGVLGGLSAFGFIGIFLGPTLLAVAYGLVQEMVRHRKARLSGEPAVVAVAGRKTGDQ